MDDMTIVWILLTVLTVLTALMIVYRISFGGYMKATDELIAFLRERNGAKDAIIEKQEQLIQAQREKIEILEKIAKLNTGGQ